MLTSIEPELKFPLQNKGGAKYSIHELNFGRSVYIAATYMQ